MAATITQDIPGLLLGLGHLFECTEFQDEVRSRSEQYLLGRQAKPDTQGVRRMTQRDSDFSQRPSDRRGGFVLLAQKSQGARWPWVHTLLVSEE